MNDPDFPDLLANSGAGDPALKVVVHWRNRNTGEKGHGQPMPLHEAKQWVQWANCEQPDLFHWLEEARP